MTRDELIALRNAIDATLPLPAPMRVMLARWLLPEPAPKPGNGRDLHPPPASAEPPPPARARPLNPLGRPAKGNAAERKLLTAMRENPGASLATLAGLIGGSRSTVGERLRQLARRGAIEKDDAGRWRIADERASPMPSPAEAEPRPTPPPG